MIAYIPIPVPVRSLVLLAFFVILKIVAGVKKAVDKIGTAGVAPKAPTMPPSTMSPPTISLPTTVGPSPPALPAPVVPRTKDTPTFVLAFDDGSQNYITGVIAERRVRVQRGTRVRFGDRWLEICQ